ncbi:MAG: hypothetical protein WBC07_04600 [Methylotenera sp.]
MQELILPFNLSMSLLSFGLVAKWYLMPKLSVMPRKEALILLLLPHTIRHMGLTFLLVGVTSQVLDARFAHPAALGDLLAAVLAFAAIFALRLEWKMAIPLVWVFNIVGVLDLLDALIRGLLYVVPSGLLGATYFIPTLIVPTLLVSHVIIFKLLLKKAG